MKTGRIWYPTFKDGTYDTKRRPRLKRYLEEMKGNIMGDIWTDIPPINSQAKERTGYPTQKTPEAARTESFKPAPTPAI